jgi:hypothetical protein
MEQRLSARASASTPAIEVGGARRFGSVVLLPARAPSVVLVSLELHIGAIASHPMIPRSWRRLR